MTIAEQLEDIETRSQFCAAAGVSPPAVVDIGSLLTIIKADREVLAWYSKMVSHEEVRGLDIGCPARKRLQE